MVALLLTKNIHCRKKVCLINAFQKVPLNTDRFCIQYNYFNPRLLRPRGKVYYDRVIMIRRTPGGYSLEFLEGVCHRHLQIQTQFQTKKCHFTHPFSDLASKIIPFGAAHTYIPYIGEYLPGKDPVSKNPALQQIL